MIARTDRLPPNDVTAERALLSTLLVDEAALLDVQGVVQPEFFYMDAHRLVYESILRIDRAGNVPDVVTLAADLEQHGRLEEAGGLDTLTAIFDTVSHGFHADQYAAIIRDRWQERQLRHLCLASLDEESRATPIGERVGNIESGCQKILQTSTASGAVSLADAMLSLTQRWESGDDIGRPTGFDRLDAFLGGLRPGTVNVIAARPGMGKTALAGCIARNFLANGLPVMFSSLEMSRSEIAQRLLALASGIPFEHLERLDQSDEITADMATESMARISDWPMTIDDSPEQSVQHISAAMRLSNKRHGLALGIVDYLQLIKPADSKVIREQQVAQMSRSLKVLARTLGIPLLLLAQLNREVENREGGKPRLRDLRESGSIEQDADSVLFIYQPDTDDPIRRDIVIAKNRHGPTGQISLEWHGRMLRFRDLVQPEIDHGFA